MIPYTITRHEIQGTQVFTALASLNNPVSYEHFWTEEEKLDEPGTMDMMVANLIYLDETYVAPIPVVSDVEAAETIPVDPVNVDAELEKLYYPAWVIGRYYYVNEQLSYESVNYKVVQAHMSQADWTPPTVPALYEPIAIIGEIPVWSQPSGVQDAYNIGDQVHYPTATDPVYESLIDANVWSPTAYPAGWQLV